MPAPTSWNVASPDPGVVSAVGFAYLNGLWFQTDNDFDFTNILQVYYSTAVDGPWSEVTPYTPVGADDVDFIGNTNVAYDGTHYAAVFAATIDGEDDDVSAWVVYATNPGGAWSKVRAAVGSVVASPFEAISYYGRTISYGGGYWVVAGYRNTFTTGAVYTPFIAYATSITGTWTVVNDPAGTGSGRSHHVGYAAGKWVLPIYDNGAGYSQLRVFTADTPGGTWTEAASFPASYASSNNSGDINSPVRDVNGYAAFTTPLRWGSSALTGNGENRLYYAADPTGTWSEVDETDLGYVSWTAGGGDLTGDTLNDVAYVGGQWLVCASTSGFYSSQESGLARSTDPAGPYTKIDDPDLKPVSYAQLAVGSRQVGAGGFSIYWANLAPATLRQRQSPKWTPSRVRSTDLRQRQTPFI